MLVGPGWMMASGQQAYHLHGGGGLSADAHAQHNNTMLHLSLSLFPNQYSNVCSPVEMLEPADRGGAGTHEHSDLLGLQDIVDVVGVCLQHQLDAAAALEVVQILQDLGDVGALVPPTLLHHTRAHNILQALPRRSLSLLNLHCNLHTTHTRDGQPTPQEEEEQKQKQEEEDEDEEQSSGATRSTHLQLVLDLIREVNMDQFEHLLEVRLDLVGDA